MCDINYSNINYNINSKVIHNRDLILGYRSGLNPLLDSWVLTDIIADLFQLRVAVETQVDFEVGAYEWEEIGRHVVQHHISPRESTG